MRRAQICRYVALALLAGTGCNEPTGPALSVINPQLGGLNATEWSVNGREGFLAVVSGTIDPWFEFQDHERVEMDVSSSGGDREELLVRSFNCDRKRILFCNRILIGLRDGYHADSLRSRLPGIDGRLTGISPDGLVAGVVTFSGNWDAAVRTIKSWPGVRIAEKMGVYFTTGAYVRTPFSTLGVNVPFDPGSPIPGNRRLEVQHGDTLTASYRQPDGSVLTARYLVDLESPVCWPLGYPVGTCNGR